MPTRIHPTAVVSPDAVLADGVEIGPYVIIEGAVSLGEGTIVRPHAHLIGPLTIGPHNDIGTGTVLGDRPQHILYTDQPTDLRIGMGNIFREYVTAHRGYLGSTVIGDRNYFMAYSHIGHDCIVGNQCMLANSVMLSGHVILQDRVLLSGSCGVHQWTRIGRLAMISGLSAATKDIPPFLIGFGRNRLAGVNVVGMRRAGIPSDQIQAVRKAFRILSRPGWTLTNALVAIQSELGEYDTIREMMKFIRESKRGVVGSGRTGKTSLDEAA